MAQGENAAEKSNHGGKEFWSRRPWSGLGIGRWIKTMTHRAERREAKG